VSFNQSLFECYQTVSTLSIGLSLGRLDHLKVLKLCYTRKWQFVPPIEVMRGLLSKAIFPLLRHLLIGFELPDTNIRKYTYQISPLNMRDTNTRIVPRALAAQLDKLTLLFDTNANVIVFDGHKLVDLLGMNAVSEEVLQIVHTAPGKQVTSVVDAFP
jgi:hypothetical protein